MSAPLVEPLEDPSVERLVGDGFLKKTPEGLRTTRRWQAAMMRASAKLMGDPNALTDLRLPVAMAVVEAYGRELPDDAIVRLVEIVSLIEARELRPAAPPATLP
jgi:hypothetical protein